MAAAPVTGRPVHRRVGRLLEILHGSGPRLEASVRQMKGQRMLLAGLPHGTGRQHAQTQLSLIHI